MATATRKLTKPQQRVMDLIRTSRVIRKDCGPLRPFIRVTDADHQEIRELTNSEKQVLKRLQEHGLVKQIETTSAKERSYNEMTPYFDGWASREHRYVVTCG